MSLLGEPLRVANAGVSLFADELEHQKARVTRIEWRPPPEAAVEAMALLALEAKTIQRANELTLDRLHQARPLLIDIGTARDVLPDMGTHTILHAGPPIEWDEMCGPLRGAIVGAALYEGLATTPEEAATKAKRGLFEFGSCHDRDAVGPMAGVVSASMPVWVVQNESSGNRAYCTLNEGLGRVLRYGAYGEDVLDRLHWIQHVLAPMLQAALKSLDEPVDLKALIAQALQMGDDGHNRNRAGTSLLLRVLTPAFFTLDIPSSDLRAGADFIARNDHFFLNLTMPASKATMDAAANIRGSSIVTAIARNGTSVGLRVSGTGKSWFCAPAPLVEGLYLAGFGPEHAAPDLGDSAITETAGIGAFAMAAAPAITSYIGGSAADGIEFTNSMYEITCGQSRAYQIPALDFAGTPLGIDCRRVVNTGVLPVINTGIAHREAGVGQIGAGIVRPPMEAFVAAVRALANELTGSR